LQIANLQLQIEKQKKKKQKKKKQKKKHTGKMPMLRTTTKAMAKETR